MILRPKNFKPCYAATFWILVVHTLIGFSAVFVESSSAASAPARSPRPAINRGPSLFGVTKATGKCSSEENQVPCEINGSSVSLTSADDMEILVPEWKQRLPAPLNEKKGTLQRIVVPGPGGRVVVVYLLGTAHVSIDSSRDVRILLESIRPNVLFLELCDQRIPLLLAQKPKETSTDQVSDQTATSSIVGENPSQRTSWWRQVRQSEAKSLYSMAATMLTSMQQDYADSLGVELGGEFRIAHDYWAHERTTRSTHALHLILGDRPLYLTLTRAWESLGVWGKTKLLAGLLFSSFTRPDPQELKEWMDSILADDSGDLLSKSMEELRRHFPTLEEVIIRERDAYMACKLYQTCRQLLSHERYSGGSGGPQSYTIVAIVGAGHVAGICRWLTVGNDKGPEEILAQLIQTKKTVSDDDCRMLVHDVMEVSHELLQELRKESTPAITPPAS
jgi:pheromone shutdown protein TraB